MILLTNASKNRTILLLKYYRIDKYFSHIFCNTQGNKFLNCMKFLQLNAENMLVFEDENLQVQYASCAGITKDRIIQIKDFDKKIFKFKKENFQWISRFVISQSKQMVIF